MKNKVEKEKEIICFKCRKPGHIKLECPVDKNDKNKKKHRRFKATWDGDDKNGSSNPSSSEGEKANLCLMETIEVISPITSLNSIQSMDYDCESSRKK